MTEDIISIIRNRQKFFPYSFQSSESPQLVLQPLLTFVGVWLPLLSKLWHCPWGELALWEWAVDSILESSCSSSQQPHLSAFKLKPWARVPVLWASLCRAMDLTHPNPDLLAWPQKADTGCNLLVYDYHRWKQEDSDCCASSVVSKRWQKIQVCLNESLFHVS